MVPNEQYLTGAELGTCYRGISSEVVEGVLPLLADRPSQLGNNFLFGWAWRPQFCEQIRNDFTSQPTTYRSPWLQLGVRTKSLSRHQRHLKLLKGTERRENVSMISVLLLRPNHG